MHRHSSIKYSHYNEPRFSENHYLARHDDLHPLPSITHPLPMQTSSLDVVNHDRFSNLSETQKTTFMHQKMHRTPSHDRPEPVFEKLIISENSRPIENVFFWFFGEVQKTRAKPFANISNIGPLRNVNKAHRAPWECQ